MEVGGGADADIADGMIPEVTASGGDIVLALPHEPPGWRAGAGYAGLFGSPMKRFVRKSHEARREVGPFDPTGPPGVGSFSNKGGPGRPEERGGDQFEYRVRSATSPTSALVREPESFLFAESRQQIGHGEAVP